MGEILSPLPLSLIFCFAGLYLLWYTRRQTRGKVLVTIGVSTLALFSFTPVADLLLKPLERSYSVLEAKAAGSAKFVVVLAGGQNSDSSVPIASRLSSDTLKRLIEGVSIWRQLPAAKLVLSGGKGFDEQAEATTMGEVLAGLGVNLGDLVSEVASNDTRNQARNVKAIVGTNEFILVTSAYHVPRATRLFRIEGLHPAVAPVGHLVKGPQWTNPGTYFPNGSALQRTERAFHEFLGLAWSLVSL